MKESTFQVAEAVLLVLILVVVVGGVLVGSGAFGSQTIHVDLDTPTPTALFVTPTTLFATPATTSPPTSSPGEPNALDCAPIGRVVLRGTAGTYSCDDAAVADQVGKVNVAWDVTSRGTDGCRVLWKYAPTAGEPFAGTVDVERGGRVEGSKMFSPAGASKGTIDVQSTCEKWLITMTAQVASTPEPTP